MIHFDWSLLLAGVSALIGLVLHGSIHVAWLKRGPEQRRAFALAEVLYWPLCGVVLATGVCFLNRVPGMAESFVRSPELFLVPMIGVAGLLGMRFCLGARWNLGSIFCSVVFLAGLVSSEFFAGEHSGVQWRDRLSLNVHGQANSDSGGPGLGARIASNDSLRRGL